MSEPDGIPIWIRSRSLTLPLLLEDKLALLALVLVLSTPAVLAALSLVLA